MQARWRGSGLFAAACLFGAALAAPSSAQDPEVTQLRRQLDEVRAAVDRLDAQLRRIESDRRAPGPEVAVTPTPAPPAASQGVSAAEPDASLSPAERASLRDQARTADALRRWGEVKAGMSQDDVRRLLGEPSSTVPVANRVGWYYRYGQATGGSVFFNHDGSVISIMAPGLGAFRLY
jgi:hypothetical protein